MSDAPTRASWSAHNPYHIQYSEETKAEGTEVLPYMPTAVKSMKSACITGHGAMLEVCGKSVSNKYAAFSSTAFSLYRSSRTEREQNLMGHGYV